MLFWLVKNIFKHDQGPSHGKNEIATSAEMEN